MAEESSLLCPSAGSAEASDAQVLGVELAAAPLAQGSALDRWLRAKTHRSLANLNCGQLTLQEEGKSLSFGKPAADGLAATIQIHSPQFYSKLAWGGTIGAAEAYMDGLWTTDNLTGVIQLMIRNQPVTGRLEGLASWLVQPLLKLWHRWRSNTTSGSRRNIAAHYDLGNDFFASFLDPSLAYSSAIYPSETASLAEGQAHKFKRICQQLNLQPSDHLVEIGSGWGGLAIHAAKNYGCKVTGVTISQQQFDLSQQRVAEAGLQSQIEIRLQDYRTLTGQFDKLVSVEMIEAVGKNFLETYFATCSRLLKPTGLMLLQGITIRDQLYPAYCRNVDFIQRYIFPGGHLPCTRAISDAVCRATDLTITQLENFPQHYARTLADWNHQFQAARPQLRRMNLPEEFLRMWEFYFAYCAGGFREEQLGLVQILFSKPQAQGMSSLT